MTSSSNMIYHIRAIVLDGCKTVWKAMEKLSPAVRFFGFSERYSCVLMETATKYH